MVRINEFGEITRPVSSNGGCGCLGFIVLLILIGTVGNWISNSPPNLKDFQRIVIQENFSNSTKGWAVTKGSKIKDGGLFQLQPKTNLAGWSLWYGHKFKDVDYSADVTKVGGPNDVSFGIIARKSDDSASFYYLTITGQGTVLMGTILQGNWKHKVKVSNGNTVNQGNARNHLRIVCQDNKILGFVNNQVVGSFQDDSISSGLIGVVSERRSGNAVAVYFDNILAKERTN